MTKKQWCIETFLASQTSIPRRQIFELVREGEVIVNNEPIYDINHPIDPQNDRVVMKGKFIAYRTDFMYYKFNKPRDVICSMSDPKGRRDLRPYVRKIDEALFPVGRLDRHTQGLLLLTNDGEFAQQVAHPKYHVPKTYIARLDQKLDAQIVKRFLAGFWMEDGPVKFDKVSLGRKTAVTLVISEGRNRIVRRAFECFGYKVEALYRESIGPVSANDLAEGESKALSKSELADLKALIALK